jgi:chromosome partitioning protein
MEDQDMKKMRVLTLLNEKGGVGKTTTSVHIAAGRALQGDRVLLIDSDPQGNATTRLGLRESPALYDLVVRLREWDGLLLAADPVRWAGDQTVQDGGSLTVLPGNIETRLIPMAVGDNIMLFKQRLAELEGYFDTIVIDTAPTPSLLHSMIYMATDVIVYPTLCQHLSLEGLGKSIAHIKAMNEARESVGLERAKLGGVLPTMYDGRTDAHKRGMSKLLPFGDQVLPPLRNLTAWKEAEYAKRTLFSYAPGSAAEKDMWQVINTLKLG